jgi:hypothetical protein
MMNTGSAERTALSRVSRPALDMSLPFQWPNRAAILSMRGWMSIFLSRRSDRGMPRYVHGKVETCRPTGCRMAVMLMSLQRIGMAWLLVRYW